MFGLACWLLPPIRCAAPAPSFFAAVRFALRLASLHLDCVKTGTALVSILILAHMHVSYA